MAMKASELSPEIVSDTLSVICKYRADTQLVRARIDTLFA
jgi:hypothetical protein